MPGQLKKPESLVRAAPDPESDKEALRELRDSGGPQAAGLAERLLSDEAWRSSPLGELLPGLPLIDAPNFSIRLSVRAANPVLKADLDGPVLMNPHHNAPSGSRTQQPWGVRAYFGACCASHCATAVAIDSPLANWPSAGRAARVTAASLLST